MIPFLALTDQFCKGPACAGGQCNRHRALDLGGPWRVRLCLKDLRRPWHRRLCWTQAGICTQIKCSKTGTGEINWTYPASTSYIITNIIINIIIIKIIIIKIILNNTAIKMIIGRLCLTGRQLTWPGGFRRSRRWKPTGRKTSSPSPSPSLSSPPSSTSSLSS